MAMASSISATSPSRDGGRGSGTRPCDFRIIHLTIQRTHLHLLVEHAYTARGPQLPGLRLKQLAASRLLTTGWLRHGLASTHEMRGPADDD
jgi:hypothetical protein